MGGEFLRVNRGVIVRVGPEPLDEDEEIEAVGGEGAADKAVTTRGASQIGRVGNTRMEPAMLLVRAL